MWDEQFFGDNSCSFDEFGAQDGMNWNPGLQLNNGFCYETIDENTKSMLISLGFTFDEIAVFEQIYNMFGKVTPMRLNQCGIPYNESQKIRYMSDIISGKTSISSVDELIKHLKKMKLSNKKVGMWDLAASKISSIPRNCIIAGLPTNTYFSLFNSGKEERRYRVVDSTPSRITFRTDIIPKIPYGDSKKLYRVVDLQQRKHMYVGNLDKISKVYREDTVRFKIDNVAEVVATNGEKVIVKVNRDYARICGRFIIVASLRYPEKHLGLAKIITLDGTKVYVYARQAGYSDKVKYSGSSERVYAYGESAKDIIPSLMEEAANVYRKVGGVYGETEPATEDFETFEKRDNNNINNGNAFEDNTTYEDEEGIASGEEENTSESNGSDW